MKFRFDINKSIASTAYLIQKAGGRHNILPLVKALYYANRTSLVKYGRTITGDALVSMDKGPVVSDTYDLMKGSKKANPDHLAKWRQFISERDVNTLRIINQPEMGYLSALDKELLDEAFWAVSNIRGSIKDWSHAVFPEWTDPGGHSVAIDPKEILRLEKKSPQEIADIEEEISSVDWLKSVAK